MRKIVILMLSFLVVQVFGSATTDKFEKRTHTTSDGSLLYRLFVPKSYDKQIKYPVILTLHGAGERGTDNTYQITKNRLAEVWAEDSTQSKQPCFVVSPQCPSSRKWVEVAAWTDIYYSTKTIPISIPLKVVLNLLDSLKREFSIDTNRIYVAGLSMGGYGSWDLISRYPSKFAAAIPLCGGCDTSKHTDIKKMAIWTFHGAVDPTVPPGGTRAMIAALKTKDSVSVVEYKTVYANYFTNPTITRANLKSSVESGAKVLFCEYTDGNHDIWAKTFNEPLLAQWLFLQKKTGAAVGIENVSVFQKNHVSVQSRFILSLPDISRDIPPNTSYVIKLYDAKGRALARTIVKSSEELKSFMKTSRAMPYGIRIMEFNQITLQ